MDESRRYLICSLEGCSFGLPVDEVQEMVSDAVTAMVPDTAAGSCGVLYWKGQLLGIRDPVGGRREPAKLQVVVCRDGHLAAFTADTVETVRVLWPDEELLLP